MAYKKRIDSLRNKLKPYSKKKSVNPYYNDGTMARIDESVIEDYESDTSPPIVEQKVIARNRKEYQGMNPVEPASFLPEDRQRDRRNKKYRTESKVKDKVNE